ncbi:MAG: methyltransferase [Alphaproteobacteria bacterium]|nr:methyltransferase [Alphaproteobacteria bacterium]
MAIPELIDRLVANPKFRRFSAGFLPFRPLARRRSKTLFDLMAGFVHTQILLACVRLNLPDLLLERPRSLTDLISLTGLSEDAMIRLLKAAIALKIVRRRGDLYGLGPVGQDVANNAAALSMIEHHVAFYADMRDPVALLKGEVPETALAAYWPYARQAGGVTENSASDYSTLMAQSQEGVAEEVLDDYSVKGRRHIMDIGGGDGTFLSAIARRAAPDTKLTLFDLPQVAQTARDRLAQNGLADRIETVGGDFLKTPLPKDADLITLIRVLFDHPDRVVAPLLTAIRGVIAPDGALLIAEPVSETPGGERIADAYFGFYLLAMGEGRVRTLARHKELLHAAGFSKIRTVSSRMPHLVRLIEARP